MMPLRSSDRKLPACVAGRLRELMSLIAPEEGKKKSPGASPGNGKKRKGKRKE